MIWVVAIVLVLFTLFFVVRPLLREDVSTSGPTDLEVYKDQLAEVDRDLKRGVISPDEATTIRTEVSRRILAADKRQQTAPQSSTAPHTATTIAAVAATLIIGVGSLALYANLGSPSLPDQPIAKRLAALQDARADRPSQDVAETAAPKPESGPIDPAYQELIDKLRQAVAQRPNDEQGLRLLAYHEANLGNFADARAAQERVIANTQTPTGEDYTNLAEYMVLAAGGYVSPQAETALSKALKSDPRNPRARYYSGLSLAQNGRPDVAYRMWAGLLEEGPADAPWIPVIRSQLPQVARDAGINLPGPTQQDVENASEMSVEDRKEMIQGMVGGLSERLAKQGGTPAEWARLIRAYGVLEETANASAIWNEAKEVFADNPQAMALLLDAAQFAEVAN